MLLSSHRESIKKVKKKKEERERETEHFLGTWEVEEKEMVLGLNKFISGVNETSNVEKFCLSGGDECMFQPHIKQY